MIAVLLQRVCPSVPAADDKTMPAFGLTVTVTVCTVPEQEPFVEVGVIVYITVCGDDTPIRPSVLFIGFAVCVAPFVPVTLGLFVAIQLNDEATLAVKVRLTLLPEQIAVVLLLVMVTVGITVTVTV